MIFNKQDHAPTGITATIAFNRLSTLALRGFKLSNPDIEFYGFELWEFSGSQFYLINHQI
ncbi:MAG: hypothetical protein LBJ72_07985 [Dysgonamonadaceae bacterium]|jgi:hypothetical protein|nr:hypothetical protein [Dysgonamonadaceae bacterium]